MYFYDVQITLSDIDSGEVLSDTCLQNFAPSFEGSRNFLLRWMDCLLRGLRTGRELHLQFNCKLKVF